MFYKRLFFISKELQLVQRITVNKVVPYTSETSGTNSSLLLRKKNPQEKRREKRKQGARLVEALKSHITHIQMFSKKFYFHFKENYNHLRKLQLTKSFSTPQKITISKAFPYISRHYKKITVLQQNFPLQIRESVANLF